MAQQQTPLTEPAVRGPDPAYRHVLVPLDGSDRAAGAMPTARALAARFGASVETVTAEHDQPADLIHRRAAELAPALVCMATHGRGPVGEVVIGSVARSVLEDGQEPIVVVGPQLSGSVSADSPMPSLVDDVVACVDGGAPSEAVVPVAAAWAHALGVRLTIVTVAEPSLPPTRPNATWHRHHGPNADADAYVAALVARWRPAAGEARGIAVHDPVSPGDGIRSYLETNPSALLVVTTHAGQRGPRVVFGSGAAGIVHAATVPVLVVPLPPLTPSVTAR